MTVPYLAGKGSKAGGEAAIKRALTGARRLLSIPKDGRGFRLSLDTAAQTVTLTVARGGKGLVTSPRRLRAKLAQYKVKAGIDREKIKRAFAYLAQADPIEVGKSGVIARGRPPRPASPGEVRYAVDVSGKAVFTGSTDEGATIDFKNATRIETVSTGDLLATVTEPVPGVDGRNLAGEVIRAPSMPPLPLTAGPGVNVSSDGKRFQASTGGRPLLLDGVLSVVPIYEVEGDVDVTTGNIRFDGHVIVKGSVQDDYSIVCKSLEVMGTVGAAEIECAERAVFAGGVNGQGRGVIRAGGSVVARYLNRSDVTALSDVVIERGITNSRVRTLGFIQAERMVGGRAIALEGISVNHLGSDLGVVTYVEPGTDFRIELLDQVLNDVDGDIERIVEPVSLYFGQPARYSELPQEEREQHKEGYAQFLELKERHEELEAERAALVAGALETGVARVNVDARLYADVIVSDGARQREFKTTRAGPLTIAFDPHAGTFDAGPYRALRRKRAPSSARDGGDQARGEIHQ